MIPTRFKVGGQEFEVKQVERCIDNALGVSVVGAGYIEIADKYDVEGGRDTPQSPTSKKNTFYHELVHCILVTMGEGELNKDEKFVSTFSSFLCEALTSLEYDTKRKSVKTVRGKEE